MRQAGVLDVGCHSALLTVARRRAGVAMEEVLSRKVRLQLHETLDATGRLGKSGVRSVQRAVAETLAENRGALPEVYAFATSVIRDAPNRDEVLAQVASATGTRLRVMSGEEEARLAYVAARHWAGERAAGSLLVLDIGGGTVEVASGSSRQPRTAHSLPLGARTVTRAWKLDEAVSSKRRLAEVRDHLSDRLAEVADLPRADPDGRVLACSKTFTQLARYTTAGRDRSRAPQRLTLDEVRAAVGVLARNGSAGRGRLPGISRHRAGQSLAGALVAEALMEACRVTSVEVSPWSTREGLLLERLGALRAKGSTPR
ncbi:Ppx/GppA phosphatase family protein [Streptomyces sp. NPDC127066]|uniref:Ppx/GppA phosphatase family protein n=1 Tax=Streptomyces sp. NPDC127066 TaxID=3347125 RepID=UPI00365615AC